jgi:hypothetical protein
MALRYLPDLTEAEAKEIFGQTVSLDQVKKKGHGASIGFGRDARLHK